MLEILAPAGDKNSFFAAIHSGANAVYLGLNEYSARKNADNFSIDEIEYYISYAHLFSAKVYVAFNTLVKDTELNSFVETVIKTHNLGADAIILQDVFLGKKIHELYPQIILHLSTQAGVCNVYAAQVAKACGFSRVILSRETKLEDIKAVSEIIETEAFVQGALCACFSGQCYFSAYVGKNSGNRGLCKQPCRKKYHIDSPNASKGEFALSTSDLCVGDKLNEYVAAGVSSIKIEGRMRRAEYVAAAVNYYKDLLINLPKTNIEADLSALKRTYNRGDYTKGLAFMQQSDFTSNAVAGHIGEYVGQIRFLNGEPYIRTSSYRGGVGDCYKILREGVEVATGVFERNVSDGVVINCKTVLLNGDAVHITTDAALNASIIPPRTKIPIRLEISVKLFGEFLVSVDGVGERLDFTMQNICLEAKNYALTEKEVIECFHKTDFYPFEIEECKAYVENVFIAKSQLNEIRRRFFKYLIVELGITREFCEYYHFNADEIRYKTRAGEFNGLAVIATESALSAIKPNTVNTLIIKPNQYFNADEHTRLISTAKTLADRVLLYLPPYASGKDAVELAVQACAYDGIYSDGLYALGLSIEKHIPLFMGSGFNIFNGLSYSVASEYSNNICLSKELSFAEQSAICPNAYSLTQGAVKLMDLIFCPFSKRCSECAKRETYAMTDEEGRRFVLRRYKTSSCRYEVYNCAVLVTDTKKKNCVVDLSALSIGQASALLYAGELESKKKAVKNFTVGLSKSSVN